MQRNPVPFCSLQMHKWKKLDSYVVFSPGHAPKSAFLRFFFSKPRITLARYKEMKFRHLGTKSYPQMCQYYRKIWWIWWQALILQFIRLLLFTCFQKTLKFKHKLQESKFVWGFFPLILYKHLKQYVSHKRFSINMIQINRWALLISKSRW